MDYAAITGRRAAGIVGTNVELWPDDLDVLFVLADEFDSVLIAGLAERLERCHPTGLFIGENHIELAHAATRATRSLVHSPNPDPLIIDAIAGAPFGAVILGPRLLVGDDVAVGLRAVLGAGADILRIRGHSDGIDMQLPGGVLCAVAGRLPQASDSSERLPACVELNLCHRLNICLADVLAAEQLILPSELKAGLVILDGCHGVVPADGEVSATWSLLLSLVRNPNVHSVLASPDYTVSTAFDRDYLLTCLMQGASIGEAAVSAASHVVPNNGHNDRFLIFGDPKWRPCAPLVEIVPSATMCSPALPPVSVLTEVRASFGVQSRETVLTELAKLGWARLVEAAAREADGIDFKAGYTCDCCRSPARVAILRGPVAKRMVLFCIRCGPVASWPMGRSQPQMKVQEDCMQISGYQPFGPWQGALILWGYRGIDLLFRRWDVAPDDSPASRMAIPVGVGRQHRRIGCLFIDEDWHLLAYPL